jgi:hypothetical protein
MVEAAVLLLAAEQDQGEDAQEPVPDGPVGARKWAEITKRHEAQVRRDIERVLHQKAFAPLGALAGVELVNVLEVNLALRERVQPTARAAR